MKFFLDNCLPPAFAVALNALSEKEGHSVTHLVHRFNRDTTDVEWLTTLANEGDWIIISADAAILRKKHEREAWLQSGLTAFFLVRGWNNLTLWEKAAHLIKRWPDIVRQADLVEPGAGFKVSPKSQKFEQVRVK